MSTETIKGSQPPLADSISSCAVTLDVNGLAEILKKSPASIRSDLSRNPRLLPPRLLIGCKKPLWLVSTVLAWLESKVAALQQSQAVLPEAPPKRKRGRPTKAEWMARQRTTGRVK